MKIKHPFIYTILFFLLFTLLPGSIAAKEQLGNYTSKDEVIYGKLDGYGKLKNLYVVNSFNITKPGDFVDYGNYTNLRNLTDLSMIEQIGSNEIRFTAEEDFYYQGELEEHELPWEISITYLLDGKEIAPDKLAGEQGKLDIHITTKANKSVNQMFFDYYLLQVSLKVDPLIFDNVHAPKGTKAKEGKDTLLSFNVMPETEEEIIITADVQNLEMDPIDIAAVPANVAFDDPDTDELTDDIQKLVDAINEVHIGVTDLKTGAGQLHDGAVTLNKGSKAFKNGINEVNNSSDALITGSKEIATALGQIDDGLNEIPELPDMPDLEAIPAELRSIANEVQTYTESLRALDDAINEIPDNPIHEEEMQKVYDALHEADDDVIEVVQQLEANYHASRIVKDLAEQNPLQLADMLEEISDNFHILADELESALKSSDMLGDLEELTALIDGLKQMTSAYKQFHQGLIHYTNGVGDLAASYGGIHQGINELTHGTTDFKKGINELHAGTSDLQKETSELPNQMKSEIDKFMEEFDYSGFEPTSFVANENKTVGVVQFVLQTEAIKILEQEEIIEEKEEKVSFWDRFLNLFK